MAKKGSAQATIGLDYSAFETGAKAVVKIAGQMATMIRDTISVAAGTILAAAFTKGASALTSFIGSMKANLAAIFSTGEELANLAHATGMATGEYMKFQLATEKGITMNEAANLLGKNADIMQKDAGIFRDVSLKLYAVGERIQGFWLGVADKIAPVLNPLLDRLASLDLSEWGKAFAAPIANAVAVITQLALDGQLWKTMGELAAAAFTYAGEILGKVISIFSTKGFSDGMAKIWESIQTFGVFLYDTLYNALSNVLNYFTLGLIIAGNKIAAIMDKMAVFTGFMSQSEAEGNKEQRERDEESIARIINKDVATPEEKTGSIVEQLKDALASTTFGNPELWEKLTGALDKFKTGESANADRFSNNKAVQNFGVSSLAAIGGGGGVGFVGLTDYAAKQTDIQSRILDQVGVLVEYTKSSPSGPSSYYSPSGKLTIK